MKRNTWLLLLVVLALFAASCGSDGDSGDDVATADDTSSAADSDDDASDDADDSDDAASDDADDADDAASDDADDADDAASDDAASDDAADTADDAADDGAMVERSGTLKMAGFAGAVTSFDPHKAASSFDISRLALTYDRLLHTTPDGGLVPGLATEWSYNDDATRLELTLREGVTFHDGTPFNAEAVQGNLERARDLEGSTVASQMAPIDSIEVIDDLHVAINLTGPNATVLTSLSDLLGTMISPAAFDNADLDVAPVGAGMYIVTDHRPGDVTVFEPYEDYWEPEAIQVERIEYYAMADPVPRVNALLTGEIDIAPIDPADVDRVDAADNVEVRLNETLRFLYLGMNKSRDALSNPDVRRAMNMAIDRQALVDALWFGLGTVSEQPWPEGYWASNSDIGPDYYPYDPEAARELMAEAGYADGFDFEVVSVPTPEAYAQLAEAIQAQLAEIGIRMTIRITEPAQLGQVYLVDQEGDGALLYTNGKLDPSGTVADRYLPEGFGNPGGHTTERIQELYEMSVSETDPDVRTEIFHDISTEITEQALEIVLFHPIEPEGVNTRVQGYESYLSGKPEYRGISVADG